jgi:uncharacterized protein (TIGR03435 family)
VIILNSLRAPGLSFEDPQGFQGMFDFHLECTDEAGTFFPPGTPVPAISSPTLSIFRALQEQLGMKLESGKDPVEILVIDHIERPSEN